MSPQDLENFISRVQDRVIKLESELADIQMSLGILLANTKELSDKMVAQKNPQNELDILAQRILILEKNNSKVVLDKVTLLESRVNKLEVKPESVKKNWWQR